MPKKKWKQYNPSDNYSIAFSKCTILCEFNNKGTNSWNPSENPLWSKPSVKPHYYFLHLIWTQNPPPHITIWTNINIYTICQDIFLQRDHPYYLQYTKYFKKLSWDHHNSQYQNYGKFRPYTYHSIMYIRIKTPRNKDMSTNMGIIFCRENIQLQWKIWRQK